MPRSAPKGSSVTLSERGTALSVFLVADTGHGWFLKQTAQVSMSNVYCALTPCVNIRSMLHMHSTAQAPAPHGRVTEREVKTEIMFVISNRKVFVFSFPER